MTMHRGSSSPRVMKSGGFTIMHKVIIRPGPYHEKENFFFFFQLFVGESVDGRGRQTPLAGVMLNEAPKIQ